MTTINEHGVKVGDFFVCSWGYDQTNVDFFKVVGVTPKGVKAQKWMSKRLDNGRLVPGDKPRTTIDWSNVDLQADYWTQQEQKVEKDVAIVTKRTRQYMKGQVSFYVASYADAYLWDGEPEADTTTYGGAGH